MIPAVKGTLSHFEKAIMVRTSTGREPRSFTAFARDHAPLFGG
jgi:hypothetical protein